MRRFVMVGLCSLALFAQAERVQTPQQEFPSYPALQPAECTVSAQQDGVSVGIKPLDSGADQKTYFLTVLSSSGFLPVLVVIHNDSNSASLLLDTGKISYGLSGSARRDPKADTAGQKAGVFAAGAIPFVGGFVAMGIAKQNSEVKQNLMLRELRSGTLEPGATMRGFLYVPVPKKGPRPQLKMEVPLSWAGSDKTSVVQLDF